MSQISPPLRILLIGCVVFMAAWFAFLKPGGNTASTPAATPAATTVPAKDPNAKTSTALGHDVQKAVAAKQQTEAAQAASSGEAATPATSSTSSTGGAVAPTQGAKPAPAGATKSKSAADALPLPLDVARAMADKKVLVMLFWNPKGADDRAVHQAIKGVGSHHGAVVVHVADVKNISRYAPITRGVDVQQSPSVVVVDRKLRGDL